jgi:hypothetical protein
MSISRARAGGVDGGARSSISDDADDGFGRKTAGERLASRRDPTMAEPFRGVVNVDIRDSEPDWSPFEPATAPEGAPNVVYIVLDDVGFSAVGMLRRAGEGLCVGHRRSGEPYVDLEREAAALIVRG